MTPAAAPTGRPVRVVFVCWGNICRSPMAERVARAWADREGLNATITSAGTSAEELGNPMDSRARAVLDRAGYASAGHRARRIEAADVRTADLVISMEELHRARLRRLVPDAANLFLISDFDPAATEGDGLADPWYGPPAGFVRTLESIEVAMPGIMDEIRRLGD